MCILSNLKIVSCQQVAFCHFLFVASLFFLRVKLLTWVVSAENIYLYNMMYQRIVAKSTLMERLKIVGIKYLLNFSFTSICSYTRDLSLIFRQSRY